MKPEKKPLERAARETEKDLIDQTDSLIDAVEEVQRHYKGLCRAMEILEDFLGSINKEA